MTTYEDLRDMALDLVNKAYRFGYECGREAGYKAHIKEDEENIRAGAYKRILPSRGMKFNFRTGEEVPDGGDE